ncbi:MAG: hypothetical protein WAP07_04095 [Acutalibacteraceae bacterium]
MSANEILEIIFNGLEIEFVKEFKFHKKRRWRIDYYLPQYRVGVEIEGGVWIQGRHTRGQGFINDCEKYNQAQIGGIRVLRYSADTIKKSPLIIETDLKKIMEEK